MRRTPRSSEEGDTVIADDLEPVVTSTTRSRPTSWIRTHPIATFAGLAYVLSWAWWIPLVVAGETITPGQGWPTHIPGLAGPLIAGSLITALTEGRAGMRRLWKQVTAWRVGWWWASVAVILALGMIGVAVSTRAPAVSELTTYSGVAQGLGALGIVAVVFLFNGLGEEVGWRGFAADRLLRSRSLTSTSLIVAAMWAPWHLPLFFALESFQGFTPVHTAGWAVGITAGSFLLAWLFRSSGGSLLLVAVWHTAFNFSSGATPATEGAAAGITSTAVLVAAAIIATVDLRANRAIEGSTSHRERP